MKKTTAIPLIVLLSFVCILPISADSIANEVKNRCDEKNLLTTKTECMSCSLNVAVNCSEGHLKVSRGSGIRDCRYFLDIRSYSLSLPGCRHLCTKVERQPKCCPGYWGPDCMDCPGGASAPCSSRGTCSDGMGGNGTCTCPGRFGGTSCEKCANDDIYGPDCQSVCDCVHGVCSSGINGDGTCLCLSGYGGPKCDQPLPDCAVLKCSENRRCAMSSSGALECKCLPNYEEKGSTCEPINPCLKKVCDAAAYCTYVGPNKHTCTCKEGYRGDGFVCLPIDPCQENFGDCPTESSVCKYDGPGKSHCDCKEGYKNFQPGTGCQLTDVCATKNTCGKHANCTTVSPGQIECTCKKGYVGNGFDCYGNLLERMKEINKEPGQWQGKLATAIGLFEAYSWQLSSLGPFTVLVPINRGIKAKDVKNLIASKENMLYFIKLHMIAGQLNVEDFNNTDLIYTLTGKSGEVTAGETDNELQIRIRGSKKRVKFLAKNLMASNGIIHIIDKAMDFVEPTLESNTKETIMDILLENGRYNRFRSLLEKSNLGPDLEKDGPYTIFVPNNDALSGMENGTLEYMLSKEGSWKLLELMRYHIVSSAELDVANIISSTQIMSMANQMIQFNTTSNGQILVNGEEVEEADVAAKNGRIYTLDGVLIPPSILPILPHRCDETKYGLKLGTCISCTMVLFSKCPEGSKPTSLFTHKCLYRSSVMGSDFPSIGCSRYCNVTIPVPQCCKGFYGPECKPCLGGFTNPCSGNGECMDGMTGNGTCICDEAFTGPDCRRCMDSNMYGLLCDKKCNCLHGRCNNHIDSDGSCLRASCKSGYTGRFCDMKTTPCGPLVTYCHAHADCEYSKKTPSCVCKPGYEGDGFHCRETNPCLAGDKKLCNVNAECIPLGSGAYKCECRPGWTGDGLDCSEINNCLLDNKGGCHANATCVYIGPGQSDCECNNGFRGDGIQCESVNTCLEEKDKCHALATCQKVAPGFWDCVCKEAYQGDGKICYGNVAEVIASLPQASEFQKWIEDPVIKSLISPSSNVTVFVPSQKAFESMSEQDKSYWMKKDKMPILLKYHILSGVFRSDDIQNLSSSDMLATSLKNNFLKLSKDNGNVTVGGANFVVGDIAAVNGVVHLIDKVLTPEQLLAGVMPDFMTRLDQMPDYSIFRGYIIEYKLATLIEASETYTIFAPHNDAINIYIRSKTPATLDEDTMRYHIILGQQLMKNDMHDGMHRETLLGFSFHVGFFMRNGEVFVNDAPLNYTNATTDKGVIHGIGKVLEIQKNRCDINDTAVNMGKCVDCLSVASACEGDTRPMPGIRKHCVYSRYSLRKKVLFIGCQVSCVRTVITKECCSGFYSQQCLSCPGVSGKPCFENGKCLDGVNGTGVCQCDEGFTGTACESCATGKYGPRCGQGCACVNGKCSEGITGDGSCECNVGWRGVKCDTAITEDKCSKTCHTSANCLEKADGTPYCHCASGFQGNGTTCTAVNACAISNGGCSVYAECRRTTPGNRNCICKQGYSGDGIVCLEINPCMENNGGCDLNAECTKTGPNQAACNCLQGYSGDGKQCKSINPCLTKNGDCSEYATCNHTGPAERTCACKSDYIGDGIICKGSIYEELRRNTNTSNFFSLLRVNFINELSTPGPFTVFVPTNDALKNEQQTSEWTNTGVMEQVILYHIVACAQLTKEDFSTVKSFTSLQGETVTVASSQNTLVLNGDAKFASEDMIVLTNGIVHLIDKVLAPKKMQQRPAKTYDSLKKVAESNGYSAFFKLLQDNELTQLIDDPLHQPVTLFLPTNEALKSLPQEQRDFLYNNQNKDKLTQYLKYHIVRDARVTTNSLLNKESIKTLQGSDLTVKCGDKDSTTGDIFLDNRQCKFVQRQLYFDGGIAYGINCFLTPLSLGGRCDSLVTMQMSGECGMCFNVPKCPSGSKPKGGKTKCQYELSSRHSIQGCRQECYMVLSMSKCCKGYYGRDCQDCPGSPETPCNKHGTCDEGYTGTGECRCSPEFNGTACELCMPGRFGPDCKRCDCTENGQCDEGITGTGECVCNREWTGKRCETKLDLPPVCTPPCSKDAVCKKDKTCECKNFYEGDGRMCKVVNLCKTNNGGCDKNAKCSQSGVKVTCSCLKGYSGDGTVCIPIDRCADGLNGGCHEHAICTMTGPDKCKCDCKDQYIGDGVNCALKQLPLDRCMQDNGQCHTDALCADLHFLDTKVGVFHLRSPKGQYKYNYSEATQACKDEDGTLATYNQLAYAQQANYHMCAAGWLDGARVGYPTAYPNPNCGSGYVGIVDYGVRVNMSETWDVFCYRYKDVQCTCKPGYVGDGYTCNGNLLQMLMSFPEFSSFLLEIFKYSNSSAKGKEFVSYISDLSIQATLFVPSNDGFNENVTLSGRDIEYHLSNVSTLYFGELSNGTSLQTRLGHKLLILYGDTTSDSEDQTRYVGGKRIIQWDYIASNGIIHLISEPLMAPPQKLVLHAGHGAGIFFGIVVVIASLALAVYAYKKYSRKDFQFQQFHEYEDKPSVSVSEFDTSPNIANPMYESAAKATTPAEPAGESVYHPFSDSDEQQLVTFGGLTK